MLLYHFTHIWHLARIMAGEGLKAHPEGLTQVEMARAMVGKSTRHRLAWLTSDPELSNQLWMVRECPKVVRLTLQVDNAEHWATWAKLNGIDDEIKHRLTWNQGGTYEKWWVVTEDIPVEKISKVELLRPDILPFIEGQMNVNFTEAYNLALENPQEFRRVFKKLKPVNGFDRMPSSLRKSLKRLAEQGLY